MTELLNNVIIISTWKHSLVKQAVAKKNDSRKGSHPNNKFIALTEKYKNRCQNNNL